MAGTAAPMELRRAPSAPAAKAAGAADAAEGIPTVRRTRKAPRAVTQTPAAAPVPGAAASGAPVQLEMPPAEIERIADKVYRQIETRLRSEKMRRGL